MIHQKLAPSYTLKGPGVPEPPALCFRRWLWWATRWPQNVYRAGACRGRA